MIQKTKKVIIAAVATISLISCAPATETLSLDVRNTASSASFSTSASGSGESWKRVNVTVLYYSHSAKWEEAFLTAYNGNWTDAIDCWINILAESSSMTRRISAEYNIALGCYLIGERQLAENWLKQAVSDCGSGRLPYYIRNLKTLMGV